MAGDLDQRKYTEATRAEVPFRSEPAIHSFREWWQGRKKGSHPSATTLAGNEMKAEMDLCHFVTVCMLVLKKQSTNKVEVSKSIKSILSSFVSTLMYEMRNPS